MQSPDESASSATQATILLVAITFILAALVLFMAPQIHSFSSDEIPAVFEIVSMEYTKKTGSWKYQNHMVVKNSGKRSYDNRKLSAKMYRNGRLLPCSIPFINFQGYINNKPDGIQTIGGTGTDNFKWVPEATIYIDYSDGTFRPGDSIRFEVYDRDTGRILSRDTYPHNEETTSEKMMKLYLSRQDV